jgi:hypothetical protein
MPSEPRGASTSPVEVGSVTKTGFWLLIDDRELYVPFDWFPWFRNVTIDALTTIERPSSNHLYWPELDVDVAVAFIEYPTVNDREMPFSKAAHRVLALAGDEAQRLCHPYVGTEHLVLALTRQTQGTLGTALRTLGVDGERVRATIETTVNHGTAATTHGRRLSYTSTTKRALVLAKDSAQALGEREISAEHLLVGVLEAKGMGGAILLHHGLSEAAALDEIKRIKGGEDTPAISDG